MQGLSFLLLCEYIWYGGCHASGCVPLIGAAAPVWVCPSYWGLPRLCVCPSYGVWVCPSYLCCSLSKGSGMNLMNIKTKEWDPKLTLEAGGTDLGNKLGMKPVPSKTAVGCISSYFVQRYGFSPSCTITSFMGDNPSSLAGMQLKQGDVVVGYYLYYMLLG